jgi:hypothetical protein
MLRLSEDNGKTWSEPRRLPEGILRPHQNKPVQLKDGTILSGSSAEGLKVGPSWQIHFERSRDNGLTREKIKVEQGEGSPASVRSRSVLMLKDRSLPVARAQAAAPRSSAPSSELTEARPGRRSAFDRFAEPLIPGTDARHPEGRTPSLDL